MANVRKTKQTINVILLCTSATKTSHSTDWCILIKTCRLPVCSSLWIASSISAGGKSGLVFLSNKQMIKYH